MFICFSFVNKIILNLFKYLYFLFVSFFHNSDVNNKI